MSTVDVSRTVMFNLGRYEQMTTTVTLKDIPATTDPVEISETLDDLMLPEIVRAAFATVHPEEDNVTSVHHWKRLIEEGMDA